MSSGVSRGSHMSDRAYAKVPAQQKTLTGSPPTSSLLRRTCACGGSPGIDGLCTECRDKRLASRGSRGRFGSSPSLVTARSNSSTQERVSSLKTFVDGVPRFGHDFSRVPVYSSHSPVLQTK